MNEATKSDIESIQRQLAETCNDPDLWILECHCIDLANETFNHDNCKICPTYINFARQHSNHIPNY